VNSRTASAFDLPDRLAAKADPALIAGDEQQFAAIAASLEQSIADLTGRLDAELREPGGIGQGAMDRDLEIHRLASRLRVLSRFGLDLCLGRMVSAENPEPVYVGRLGLTDSTGGRLLVDWRSPAAEPFFGATHGNPMGLASRRRYRWTLGRVSDYWDEVFTADGLTGHAALDDQSAFIASLGSSRSARMRDVLATIAADQDAVIRAGSRGALVVDGGPGTGKTVVALHRAAYLLYSDPRLGHRRGGVLFVGPHQPYLAYVADVLPSLGEEGVQTCTLRDLVAEGAAARPETDPEVARLKSSADLVKAIEPAVRFYENLPDQGMTVKTPWSDLWLSPDDWAEAFDAPEPGTAHNEARDRIWEELIAILTDKFDGDAPPDLLRRSLLQNRELREALNRAWPLIEPADLVGDLWTVPAYLRKCAPWLSIADVRALQRPDGQAWTVSDLPLLDAARLRLGDPEAPRRKRQQEAAVAAEREQMEKVLENLIEAADDEYGGGLVTMLRGEDFQDALVDEAALPTADPDVLAGPFAHIVVDEAQELTDAEWQMLLLRCPSRSFTIVGDRAQARHGFTESWRQRLERIGFDRITLATLSINYRTPEEVMAVAEPVIRAVLPDANVPASIRRSGVPVVYGSVSELDSVLGTWLAAQADGIACVIGDPAFLATSRVRSLSPELSKGLEFDLVVLVDPESFGQGIEGAVDRYVAMTRATQQLVILTSSPEAAELGDGSPGNQFGGADGGGQGGRAAGAGVHVSRGVSELDHVLVTMVNSAGENLLGRQRTGRGLRQHGRGRGDSGRVDRGQRGRRGPGGGRARRPQALAEGGQRPQYRGGGGGRVHQHDRVAVPVLQVPDGGLIGQPGQPRPGLVRPRGDDRRGQRRLPARQPRQPGQAFHDTAGLVGDPGHRGQCGRRGELRRLVPAGWPRFRRRARHRLPPGGPVGQPVGKLGEMLRGLAVGQQRLHRMPGAYDAVRGGRDEAGQQPWPPRVKHLPPRLAGHLPAEVRGPVGHPMRIAKRLLPLRADRADAPREVLQPPHVGVEPPVHVLGLAAAGHRLGDHRSVVGQEAVELRSGGMQPLVGLVECPRGVGGHVLPRDCGRYPGR
jgi:hypothetical protein